MVLLLLLFSTVFAQTGGASSTGEDVALIVRYYECNVPRTLNASSTDIKKCKERATFRQEGRVTSKTGQTQQLEGLSTGGGDDPTFLKWKAGTQRVCIEYTQETRACCSEQDTACGASDTLTQICKEYNDWCKLDGKQESFFLMHCCDTESVARGSCDPEPGGGTGEDPDARVVIYEVECAASSPRRLLLGSAASLFMLLLAHALT